MEREVIKAVERAKSSAFKATAIKVELEAHLSRDIWDIDDCHRDMLEGLREFCLVDKDGNYVSPLTYCDTYNDGSVDTEFTFTLLLKDPKTILLLPKIITVWNKMCEQARSGKVDVRGAGMHMAWLNDKEGYYPSRITDANLRRFANFQRSMSLALPALYFLATHNNISRGLEWRKPRVEYNNAEHGSGKANAIHYKGGALEFRVFDTCYHNPEAILDNVVVMSNCLKFWTNTYTDPGLSKIASKVRFGTDRGRKLERFYQTASQYDLLEAGLNILKPSYRTIEELKAERNFTIERPTDQKRALLAEAEVMYEEYVERYKHQQQRGFWLSPKMPKSTFLRNKIREIEESIQGNYELTA